MKETLTSLAVAGGAFLIADRVAKGLPATAGYAIGWGSLATAGTLVAANATIGKGSNAMAAATGVALAYLHAYVHQTPYPQKQLTSAS